MKTAVSMVTGVAPHRQRLIFRGTILQDDVALLDYGIAEDGQVVQMVLVVS